MTTSRTSLPFRTVAKLSSLTDQDLQNRVDALRHWRDPDQTELDHLIHHADERIVIAFVRMGLIQRWPKNTAKYTCNQMILRALYDAEQEGSLWTPLLDELAAQDLWRSKPHNPKMLKIWEEDRASSDPRIPEPHVYLEQLVSWIRNQTSPDVLMSLFEFHYSDLFELIAKHAQVLSAALVEHLLARNPSTGAQLAQNPAMPAKWLNELGKWALFGALDPKFVAERGFTTLWPVRQYPFSRSSRLSTLLALHRRGMLDSTMIDCCIDWIASQPKRDKHERRRGSDYRKQSVVDFMIALADSLDQTRLRRFYDAIQDDSNKVAQLLQAPNLGVEFLRHVMSRDRSPYVRKALVQNSIARQDPEIRGKLMRSTSCDVLSELLKDTTEGEASILFRRLARLHPIDAMKLLQSADSTLLRMLSRDDVEHALQLKSSPFAYPHIKLETLIALRSHLLADVSGEEIARAHIRPMFAEAYRATRQLLVPLLNDTQAFVGLLEPEDLLPLLNSSDSATRIAAIRLLSQTIPENAQDASPKVSSPKGSRKP